MQNNVKELRTARRWSQERLGRETGLSAHTIRNVELGHFSPTLKTARRIAQALGSDFGDVFPTNGEREAANG